MRNGSRCVGAVLMVEALVVAAVALWLMQKGLSAKESPAAIEIYVARLFRHLAVPASARQATNPVRLTADVLSKARGHFADHCAICHGNDGRGQTEIGRNLYPKAPDMSRPATQKMTDGEIFYTIKQGVRLTGMPGWGEDTDKDDRESWALVHFIRHLPEMTPEEIAGMEALNPKSPEELRQQQQEREFLEGEASKPAQGHPHTHEGKEGK